MNKTLTIVLAAVVLLIGVGFLIAQQPVSISSAIPAGANTIGAVSQASGPWTTNQTQLNGVGLGSPSNYGTSPGTVSVQGVNAFITNSPAVSFAPSASSSVAMSRFHASTAAAASVKASAGNLYGLALGNSGTVPCWLQIFNTAGTPTAGTSVVDSYFVQAGVALVIPVGTFALTNYATGIGVAGATSDSGATTAGCTSTFSVTAYYQ